MSSQNKAATDTKPSWQARVHRWWEVTEGVCVCGGNALAVQGDCSQQHRGWCGRQGMDARRIQARKDNWELGRLLGSSHGVTRGIRPRRPHQVTKF